MLVKHLRVYWKNEQRSMSVQLTQVMLRRKPSTCDEETGLWKQDGCREDYTTLDGRTRRGVDVVTKKRARKSKGCTSHRHGGEPETRSQKTWGSDQCSLEGRIRQKVSRGRRSAAFASDGIVKRMWERFAVKKRWANNLLEGATTAVQLETSGSWQGESPYKQELELLRLSGYAFGWHFDASSD